MAVACADTLVFVDRTERDGVSVAEVTGEAIVCLDADRVPVSRVSRVVFSRPAVCRYASGVVLLDGTVLGGVPRRSSGRVLTFRSVACGVLSVPLERVAALYYEPAFLEAPPSRDGDGATVLLRDGTKASGKLLWADTKSVAVLGSEGLRKVQAGDVSGVVLRELPALGATVLRNGDRLARVRGLDGASVTAEIDGGPRSLPLVAVKELDLSVIRASNTTNENDDGRDRERDKEQ